MTRITTHRRFELESLPAGQLLNSAGSAFTEGVIVTTTALRTQSEPRCGFFRLIFALLCWAPPRTSAQSHEGCQIGVL